MFWPEYFHLSSVFSAQFWSQNGKNKIQTKNKPSALQTKLPGNAILKNYNKEGEESEFFSFFKKNHCWNVSSKVWTSNVVIEQLSLGRH